MGAECVTRPCGVGTLERANMQMVEECLRFRMPLDDIYKTLILDGEMGHPYIRMSG